MTMSKDDTQRGLYAKYTVIKNSDPNSEFSAFVLNLDTDPYAVDALRAYAKACADKYPILASDLERVATACQVQFAERAIEELQNDDSSIIS